MKKYDFIIVGIGLYGATFANIAKKHNKKVLLIDKRDHIGGNIFTKEIDGIYVHQYGAHIFHTSYDDVWEYVNSFVPFNDFINTVIANYNGRLYHLPFNMNTFKEMWGVETAEEAKKIIDDQIKKENITNITNLEDQALSLVGRDIYETLIKGYTEKQWGRKATELPSFIIKRLPLRFEYNNNYFNDKYQGIPIGGYTKLIEKMIDGCDVILSSDFLKEKEKYMSLGETIIYTGPIDEYFDYKYGELEYRSLKFEVLKFEKEYFQNNAVINYTSYDVPFTRIIEHKYFENQKTPTTIITREYPDSYERGKERYYPINNEKNDSLYLKYKDEASKLDNIYFGGRLGTYKYYDMDDVIKQAFDDAREIIK